MKNRIIYTIIVILSFALLFFLVNIYSNYKIDREKKLLRDQISEIYYNDFENFILENPTAYIYISREDYQDYDFNDKVITLVNEKTLEEQFVLLFLNDYEKTMMESRLDIPLDLPSVLYFKNRELEKVIIEFDSTDSFFEAIGEPND